MHCISDKTLIQIEQHLRSIPKKTTQYRPKMIAALAFEGL